MPDYLHTEKNGATVIHVHVIPNAQRTDIQGLHDGALKLRLKSPPVDGRANAEVLLWLAATLEVPRAAVELLRGQTSRRKQLRIAAAYCGQARWDRLAPVQTPNTAGVTE